MPNFRVEYAQRGIKINNVVVHGIQSANITTSFNLEPVFEGGQIEVYENLETLPEVSFSIEKVLDGYPLIYETATGAAATNTLIDRSNQKAQIEIFIYPDSQTEAGSVDDSTVAAQVTLSDMFISSMNYNLGVDGNFTESITFVGNDKSWAVNDFIVDTVFGADVPLDTVKRRQHLRMEEIVASDGKASIWPKSIQGIDQTTGFNVLTGSDFATHFGDISFSVDLNRTDFFEQGRRKPYFKRADPRIDVDVTLNIKAGGVDPGDGVDADSESTSNLVNNSLKIQLTDDTVFDFGDKLKILTVTESGGNTDGEALEYAYAMKTFSKLDITSPP